MALTKSSYSMINSAPVSVLDFMTAAEREGCIDGSVDVTAPIQAARDYIFASPNTRELIFPSGVYTYSVSPNWGFDGAKIRADGNVLLNYTGTGNCLIFDAGATGDGGANLVEFLGGFTVKGTASAQNGIFVRSISRSKIEARVAGCGPTYSGLLINFAVCTEFKVIVSSNIGSFGAAKPKYGYYCSYRASNERTSACVFYLPVVEGVDSHGIYLNGADNNVFIGGTSEGNGGYGIYSAASNRNSFYGIDCEANAGSLFENGIYNLYNSVLFSDPSEINGTNISFISGQYGNIVINSAGSLNILGTSVEGSITNNGRLSSQNNYNVTAGTFSIDLKGSSKEALTEIPTATPTTTIVLPDANNIFYQIYTYPLNSTDTDYAAYAVVYKAVNNATIMSQVNGAHMSLTLSGRNVQVTQTSGSTLLVKTVAQAI